MPRVRTSMTADGVEGEAEPAAPRLKRVRKRRKDAGSVATADDGEDRETAEVWPSSAVDAGPPTSVETFESARGPAVVEAESLPQVDVTPQVVAPQQAVAEVPRSAGVTKGTKVCMYMTVVDNRC